MGQILLPEHVDDLDRLELAEHARGAERAHAQARRVGHAAHGACGRDDLVALGQRLVGHARGRVDRIAEHVVGIDQRVAVMQPDADAEVVAREVRIGLDAALHVGRREQAVQRTGKRAHDLVADRLDDASAMPRGDLGQRDQHAADDAHRRFIAARLEKLGAAGHIGEEDRECAALGHGAADDR